MDIILVDIFAKVMYDIKIMSKKEAMELYLTNIQNHNHAIFFKNIIAGAEFHIQLLREAKKLWKDYYIENMTKLDYKIDWIVNGPCISCKIIL